MLSGGTGVCFIFTHTHTQSQIMGKRLETLTLTKKKSSLQQFYFSSLPESLVIISIALLSFSPSTSVCCSPRPPDAQAQKLCCACVYLLSALHFASLCKYVMCLYAAALWNTTLPCLACFHEHHYMEKSKMIHFYCFYCQLLTLKIHLNTKNNLRNLEHCFSITSFKKRTRKHKHSHVTVCYSNFIMSYFKAHFYLNYFMIFLNGYFIVF